MLSNNLMVYQKDKSCETFLIGLVERRKQVVDNRNIDGVWSANSIFFGMFSKMICTSPLTNEAEIILTEEITSLIGTITIFYKEV